MIRRLFSWLVRPRWTPDRQILYNRMMDAEMAKLAGSALGRIGRQAQLSAAQAKMDAKHAQLRAEMGVRS